MSHKPPLLTQTASSKFENESQNDRGTEKLEARTSLDTTYKLPSGDQWVIVLCEPIDTSLVSFFNRHSGMFS